MLSFGASGQVLWPSALRSNSWRDVCRNPGHLKLLRVGAWRYGSRAEELEKHGGSLVDKTVELEVRDISQNFSGRIRMSGAIVKVGP